MKKLLIYSLLTIFIFGLIYFWPKKQNQSNTIDIDINGTKYNLEIAQTIFEKSRGLSKRSGLCPNCGMIFVYQAESIYPFWMKDTLIPLDIIWVDGQGKVVDIKTGKPNDLTPLVNQTPAQYIIELNPNVSGLKIGDIIDFPVQTGLKPVSTN